MKKLTQWARENRRKATPAEKALRRCLLRWKIKFRTQRMMRQYIVDFLIPDRWLIVELDGGYHVTRAAKDAKRDAFLRGLGFTVMRFQNETVFENCFEILTAITSVPVRPPPKNWEDLYGRADY